MRALLVVNPMATATTPQTREVLASALSSEVKLDVAVTQSRGHAVELAAQARVDGLDVVVALGGDGTVNEVVNGLLAGGPSPDGPALGVVPGGNANVFARALGLPNSAVEATSVLLQALAGERRRRLGLGRVEAGDGHAERWFTFCAGLGLDAAVVRRVDRKRARGARATPALFVRQGLTEFATSRRRTPALLLERDGAEPEPVGMALVCNTDPWTFLGALPVRACPDASFDAGLDLFGVRRLTTVATLRHLRQILQPGARPRGRTVLQVHDADELRLTALAPVPLQVDGDDLGDRRRVVLRSVPAALDVLV